MKRLTEMTMIPKTTLYRLVGRIAKEGVLETSGRGGEEARITEEGRAILTNQIPLEGYIYALNLT